MASLSLSKSKKNGGVVLLSGHKGANAMNPTSTNANKATSGHEQNAPVMHYISRKSQPSNSSRRDGNTHHFGIEQNQGLSQRKIKHMLVRFSNTKDGQS